MKKMTKEGKTLNVSEPLESDSVFLEIDRDGNMKTYLQDGGYILFTNIKVYEEGDTLFIEADRKDCPAPDYAPTGKKLS